MEVGPGCGHMYPDPDAMWIMRMENDVSGCRARAQIHVGVHRTAVARKNHGTFESTHTLFVDSGTHSQGSCDPTALKFYPKPQSRCGVLASSSKHGCSSSLDGSFGGPQQWHQDLS
eukprot:5313774-Alexandrium_andersonii.AAC.1